MFTKTLLFVYLGMTITFVVAEKNKTIIVNENDFESFLRSLDLEIREEAQLNTSLARKKSSRSLEAEWNKLKSTWNRVVSKVKTEVEDLVSKGKAAFEIVNQRLPLITAKISKLIDDVKKTYQEVVLEGKEAVVEIEGFYDSLKLAYDELKKPGLEAYQDFRDFAKEIKKIINVISVTVTALKAVG